MFREAMKHQGKTEDFPYNIREVSCGTSRAYSIAALAPSTCCVPLCEHLPPSVYLRYVG